MMFCRLYRWHISNAVDGQQRLSESVLAHLRRCPDCRSFLSISMRLDRELSSRAIQPDPERLDRLNEQIFSAVRAVQQPAAVHHRRIPRVAFAAAAVLFVGTAIAFLAMRDRGEPPVAQGQTDPVAALRQIASEVAARTPVQADPAAISNMVAKPYSDELARLAGETESAIKFVASCVGVTVPRERILPEI